MTRPTNVFDLMLSASLLSRLAWEAQSVATMRAFGIAGFWSVAPSENLRMVWEKPAAFADALGEATSAAIDGARPDEVLDAWTGALRRRTASNMRRLSRQGPRLGL